MHCDSSLRATRQIELAMHHAMLMTIISGFGDALLPQKGGSNLILTKCGGVSIYSFCQLAGILGLSLIKDFKLMSFHSYP